MLLKDISFSTPQENIAFDDVLFQLADKNGDLEYLRFWESPVYFIVLGRIGREEDDINLNQARSDGVPVLRRSSGGGTVVQGKGCLNYTLILSKSNYPMLNDLRASYAWISQKIIDSLSPLGVKAVFRPISDIALENNEKKFSGNAQRRGKTHILHHGTILYDFNLELISKYLLMPKDIPQYRKSRGHNDFVTNVPIQPQLFKVALAKAFKLPFKPQLMTDKENTSLRKYINDFIK